MDDRAAPSAPSAVGPGLAGALALVGTLAGALLWLLMLSGPFRLATGILDSAGHLARAERKLSAGEIRGARVQTLLGTAAAQRARLGLECGGPLLDVASLLPRFGEALGEVDHIVRAAELSAAAAAGTLRVADDALKGGLVRPDPDNPKGGSIVDLERVREIGAVVSHVGDKIAGVRRELEAIDLAALPRRARPRVTEGIGKARKAAARLADAEAGFAVLPGILGADGPRTYLIGFQNPAEQRGTGGAILQFSTLSMDGGRLALGRGREDRDAARTVYEIDRNRTQYDLPLPEDAFYVRGIADAQRFGNANWSPDWPRSARLMIAYAEAAEAANPQEIEVPRFDGFLVVDPLAVEKMMRGVGPFRAASHRITQGNIVRFLLYRAYGVYPIPSFRRAVLRKVVEGFFAKAINPREPPELAAGMGEALTEKHIQIWMRRATEQAFVRQMGWDGAIRRAADSDYLFVVEQNVGGNKLDYFARNSTTVEVRIEGDDALVSTEARVENHVFGPQPRWIMGDSGPLHLPMLNIYVPGRARLQSAETLGPRRDTPAPAAWPTPGVPARHVEAGKTVWSATLLIPAEDEGAFRVRYRVPDAVSRGRTRRFYRLVVQHQPRVDPDRLAVRLRLPPGAEAVRAPGWNRAGDVLVYRRLLTRDLELEVSWRR